MNVTGTLKLKKAEQKVSDSFKKREFVITDNTSRYPQHIVFQLAQANCELIDQFESGEELRVHFNIRGREWVSPEGDVKYFNTLEAWKIERVNERNSIPDDQGFPPQFTADSNDLPF